MGGRTHAAVPLGLALHHLWQIPLLVGAAIWLLLARHGVVSCLLVTGARGRLGPRRCAAVSARDRATLLAQRGASYTATQRRDLVGEEPFDVKSAATQTRGGDLPARS